jgi:RNA-directed DNA polymerase
MLVTQVSPDSLFYKSQPIDRVIELINPKLRGWLNYFPIGHASRCFSYIWDWVEKKVRRHLIRALKRGGFGWNRWSRGWVYKNLSFTVTTRFDITVPKALPGDRHNKLLYEDKRKAHCWKSA